MWARCRSIYRLTCSDLLLPLEHLSFLVYHSPSIPPPPPLHLNPKVQFGHSAHMKWREGNDRSEGGQQQQQQQPRQHTGVLGTHQMHATTSQAQIPPAVPDSQHPSSAHNRSLAAETYRQEVLAATAAAVAAAAVATSGGNGGQVNAPAPEEDQDAPVLV
jgi:hypothetical protein